MTLASKPTHHTGNVPDTDAAALIEQASALSRELREEHRRLNPAGVGAHVELSSRLQNVRERVDLIATDLGAPDADVATGASSLAGLRGEARDLFGECFDVAVRPLVRGPDLGRGACEIADVLLCSVAQRCGIQWPHFTSIGAADFFTSVSHIVRLAYPPSPIWNLAIAVHELGHYCGPNWPGPEEKNPYEKFRVRVEVANEHREELFADMFAVYTVGPAFVLACLARFNPVNRTLERKGLTKSPHPPDTQRAAWILAGLDAVAGSSVGDSGAILRKVTNLAGERWNALCRACREPRPGNLVALQDEAERLVSALRTSRPDAMYGDVRGALALRAAYPGLAAGAARPHPIDVLNAAWFLRLDPEYADAAALNGIERWGGNLIRGFTCP